MADTLKDLEEMLIAAHKARDTKAAEILVAEMDRMSGASAQPQVLGKMAAEDFTMALKNAKTPEEKQAIVAAQGTPSSEGAGSLGGQIGRELMFGPRMAAKWLSGHRGEAGDIALRAAGPAIGQRLAGPAGKFVGGMAGELAAQFREGGGISPGQVKNALTYGAANVAGQTVGTGIDQQRLPTPQEAGKAASMGALSAGIERGLDGGKRAQNALESRIRNAVVNNVVADATEAGYKVLPSKVNPTAINKALDFIAGKKETLEEMRIRNENIARSLALKEIGRPQIVESLQAEINAAKTKASVPYSKIEVLADYAKQQADALKRPVLSDAHESAISQFEPAYVNKMASLATQAAADIESWRSWRKAEQIHWKSVDDPNFSGNRVEAEIKAKEAGVLARELEDKILKATEEMGQPELYKELKAAQVIYAKAHEIENVLGARDAPDMSKIGRSKAPLTGELRTMARVGKEFPESSKSSRDDGYSDYAIATRRGTLAGVGGGIGFAAGGPVGAALGASGAALSAGGISKVARNFLLSDRWQKYGTVPTYGGGPDFGSQLGRFGTNALGRTGNPFLTPLPQSTDQAPNNPFLRR